MAGPFGGQQASSWGGGAGAEGNGDAVIAIGDAGGADGSVSGATVWARDRDLHHGFDSTDMILCTCSSL